MENLIDDLDDTLMIRPRISEWVENQLEAMVLRLNEELEEWEGDYYKGERQLIYLQRAAVQKALDELAEIK